ncbi:hypothetical protein [Luedemannella flava]|uniref:hypothetical protein n=1 Tax=Luedemannella flava TaxID=349316 RepID=UPI0031D84B17
MSDDSGGYEYGDDTGHPDALFLLGCIVATVLGISLLIARSALDLGVWSVIVGFVCLGLATPFVFFFLGRHVAVPADRLVFYFGYALPGIALVAIGTIVWHVGLTSEIARKGWGILIIFGLVWLVSFLGGGIGRFWWLRRNGHSGVPHSPDEHVDVGEPTRRGWTSFEWASLLVAVAGTAASIAAVLVEVMN